MPLAIDDTPHCRDYVDLRKEWHLDSEGTKCAVGRCTFDVPLLIFSYSDISVLLRCEQVCEPWLTLIRGQTETIWRPKLFGAFPPACFPRLYGSETWRDVVLLWHAWQQKWQPEPKTLLDVQPVEALDRVSSNLVRELLGVVNSSLSSTAMGAFPDGFVIRSDWPRSVDHIFDTYEVNRHDWEFESLDTQADYIRPTDVVARQSEGDDTKFELIQLTSVGITKPLIQLASIKESTALRPRTITGPTCLTATKFRIKNQVYLESILYPGPTSLFQCFRAPFVCNNENLLFHLQPQDPNAALRLVRLYDGIEMFRKVHRRDTRIIAAHMTRLNLFLLEIFPPKPPRCPVSRTLCSVYELRFLKKLYHFRCPDGTLGLTSTNDGRVVLDVANAAKGSVSKWVLDPVAGGCVDLRDRGVGYYCLVREFEARDGIRTGRPGVDRVFFRDVKCKSSDVDVQMVK